MNTSVDKKTPPKVKYNINGSIVDGENLEVPPRLFRDAWDLDGNAVFVDMEKARNIWRDNIRRVREPALEQLDVDFMKAMERGEDTKPIVERKQALRDAPADPKIDSAATPEELRLVQPAGLVVR